MRTSKYLCVCVCLVGSLAQAAERPTLLKTCDPRPDILPRPFYDNHTEYRAQYNRPRFYTGLLAYGISRTSQEAMVWQENYCAGNYDQHHMPPMYKKYYYPKPWEVLNVAARPDFASAEPQTERVPGSTPNESDETTLSEGSSRKPKSEDTERAFEGGKSDAKEIDKNREVVPSPSDKSTSIPTRLPARFRTPSISFR